MPAVLVTGANRGIGLAHAERYAHSGWAVHACARRPEQSAALQALQSAFPQTVALHRLDVTEAAAVAALAEQLRDQPIDILLNNAGTFGPQGAPEGMAYQALDNMDYDIWRTILEVNLLAPFRVATAFREHLGGGHRKLLVMMSSGLASIADSQGSSYAYRSSKAGLNMLARGMAAEWPELIVIALAPGWCNTDLGGAAAPVDVADSVRDQQALFTRLTAADSGRFIDRFGQTVPW
ncbi:MAG: SDR family NAD(P)-dependent oxidoreductase [Gammaproteobacteria bacterium]|jgi:NAD(P)-dependent dehydrogenase (short-subunit alcohol dehydrogenase family)|nr:SDR family NAD(P)-dependent oxidoreductase [Gammaproteobacteria bacterium]